MLEFMMFAMVVWLVFICWPVAHQPIGEISLFCAVFFALPLGWLLTRTDNAPLGWALLALIVWVLTRWLRDKWQEQ
jgi:thiol:disulfide interchange protein